MHVASPLLFEFRQSLRWQAYLYEKDRAKGFDRDAAQTSLALLQSDINGGFVAIAPVSWHEVAAFAERLSAQYTWTGGHRTLDIIHVATALHLGAREFLTFDANQKKLAEAEGLRVPL